MLMLLKSEASSLPALPRVYFRNQEPMDVRAHWQSSFLKLTWVMRIKCLGADTIFDFPFDNRPTWLLDWAVAGQGSPLRDLVFFLVIGCTEEDRENFEEIALRAYHGELLQEGENSTIYHIHTDVQ